MNVKKTAGQHFFVDNSRRNVSHAFKRSHFVAMACLLGGLFAAHRAQAQTYNMAYGNGYDPLQGAISVLNGTSSVIQSGQQNYQNSLSGMQQQNSQNAQNNAQAQESQKAAAAAAAQQSAAEQMGYGKLGTNSVPSILPQTDTKKSATTNTGSDSNTPSVNDDGSQNFGDPYDSQYSVKNFDPTTDMTPQEKQRHAELQKILSGNAPGSTAPKQANKTSAPPKTTSRIVYGKAIALDGVTISVGGTTVVLAGLRGPGNAQLCYHSGVPWQCGQFAREALENIVDNAYISCDIIDGQGYCTEEDGSNVSERAAERGYAVGTVPETMRKTRLAINSHVGLFQ